MDDDISDMLARFNRFTNWKANDMVFQNQIEGNLSGLFKALIAFDFRFCKSFILKKGYKEGILGFVIAVLAGLYPLVSYLKAKELAKVKKSKA